MAKKKVRAKKEVLKQLNYKSLKVCTYNCWHGRTSKSLLEFSSLEDPKRHQKRLQIQLEELKSLSADIFFLQEVSPMNLRSQQVSQYLGYDSVHQIDQSGMKLFGVGLPKGLDTGLCILAHPKYKLKKLFGLKLSGSPGRIGSQFSFQFNENRFALFAQITLEDNQTILLVNTHLHHGTESHPWILYQIGKFEEQNLISNEQALILKSEIKSADDRRQSELEILFSAIDELKNSFSAVILAGDFNSDRNSKAYQFVVDKNLTDSYAELHPSQNTPTWDVGTNSENILIGRNFDLPMSDFGNPKVKQLFVDYNERPRCIDFIFYTDLELNLKPRKSDVCLVYSEKEKMFGSDHLGVLTEFVY